jgi:hypothetical protein
MNYRLGLGAKVMVHWNSWMAIDKAQVSVYKRSDAKIDSFIWHDYAVIP